MSALLQAITARTADVVVVGIGYVGLPLAVELAQAGFQVTGYDHSREKVAALSAGDSYIGDIPSDRVRPLVGAGRLRATTDPEVLGRADVVVVCVPTPLNKTRDPDNSFILAAADELAPRLRKGTLVILESTTFPGFTREVLVPRLQQTGLRAGSDFHIAFSPERVDPGNPRYHTHNTPKIVGGLTPACTELTLALYGQVIERLIPVSTPDAAEMVKLLENTFRAVNIGLVNEVAIMCGKLGLDVWEIIDAAATKPFGYMPFYPGPGLGGHCIPVDPLYLSWKLRALNYNARFIQVADEVNRGMPDLVIERVALALNDDARALRGSNILVLGVAYKRDIDDMRESPALDILELLHARGARVAYHDPHVPGLRVDLHGGQTLELRSVELTQLAAYDAVVIVTDHRAVDYARVVAEARVVLDTRNVTKAVRGGARARVVTL
ncbi:MAG: nucleotide sugar dehydrogenase [Myxococcales bacterium]|nr:nucleotide sugar dehydrogenase [Myxococcales bacterium]